MEHILELAEKNQREAWEVIRKTDVMNIWKSVGAEINLVGSLNMGLLVKNRDGFPYLFFSSDSGRQLHGDGEAGGKPVCQADNL